MMQYKKKDYKKKKENKKEVFINYLFQRLTDRIIYFILIFITLIFKYRL